MAKYTKFNPKSMKGLKTVNFIINLLYHKKKATTSIIWKDVKEILLIDFGAIGDMVMLTSALRVIKKNAPSGRITLVAGPCAKEVLDEQNLVDEYIIINPSYILSVKCCLRNLGAVKAKIREIKKKTYDIAIEPRGDLRLIYFMHFAKAKRYASYDYTGGEGLLTDFIKPNPSKKHLVQEKMFFLKTLGCKFDEIDEQPLLVLPESGKKVARDYIIKAGLEDRFLIGIHTGASKEYKKWPYYCQCAELLCDHYGDKVAFILFEAENEASDAAAIERILKKCAVKYVRFKEDFKSYTHMLSQCNLLICNDSGPGHIANAYGVETHVIFGPLEPDSCRPYRGDNAYCYSAELTCKPCCDKICRRNNECIMAIAPETVANKIMALHLL